MPMASLTEAAEDQQAAAKAHHAAAELHGKGDLAAMEKSTKAHSRFFSADKSTADALKLSAAKAKK